LVSFAVFLGFYWFPYATPAVAFVHAVVDVMDVATMDIVVYMLL